MVTRQGSLRSLLHSVRTWRHQRRRARKRLRMLADADFVVVSAGKSGRTWFRVMLSHLYHLRYGVPEDELLSFDNYHRHDPAIPRILFTHDQRADPWNAGGRARAEPFRGKRVLLLVRDPRDVVVSMYFHRSKRAEPEAGETEPVRDLAQEVSIADYLLGDEGRLPIHVRMLNRWQQRLAGLPGSAMVRYEDLRARPEAEMARVAQFFGGGFDPSHIRAAVEFATFERMREKEAQSYFTTDRLRPGTSDDPDSFKVRRGKVGGWRDYVTADEAEAIDAYLAVQLDSAYGYGVTAPRTSRAQIQA